MVVVFVVGFVFVLNMYIPVVSGIRDNVFCFYRDIYEESLGSCASEGFGFKGGSLLLSRIALQYHRRNRA